MRLFPLLIFLPLLGFERAHGETPLTSGTLTIQANRLTGDPVGGVTFHVQDEADVEQSVTTDSSGKAVVLYAARGALTLPRMEVVGDDFIVTGTNSSNTRGSQGIVARVEFLLLPTDREMMTREELGAFAHHPQAVIGNLHERWSQEKGEANEPGILRFAAFLEGIREEAITVALPTREAVEGETGEEAPEPNGIIIRLVDAHGNAVPNRRVLLFSQDEDSGEVQVHSSVRTNSRGLALLEVHEPGRFYRVEVPSAGDGMIARGPVFLGREEIIARDNPRVMVLRRESRMISGMVFNGDRPAGGVLIETATPGEPVLATRVDDMGYFDIGPVQGERVVLAIRRSANSEPVLFTATPGTREHFIPLDLLLLAHDR